MAIVDVSTTPDSKSATDTKDAANRSVSSLSIDKKVASVELRDVLVEDLPEGQEQQFKWTNVLFRRRQSKPLDLDSIATRRSVFDDPNLAPHYWPKKEYENLHRFDPNARWTYREEQAIVRKIDWKIMLWTAISFSALNLDRSNINQANSSNFLPDLGLTTDDFNLGNTIFRLTFLFAELPSQLVSKRMGPDRWIPIQICLWSLVTLSQFWLTGRTTFLLCRALIGYTELPVRLAIFWMSLNFCAIVASFIAFGTLRLDGYGGKAGWRGVLTLVIGLATFFRMPPSPTQTKTWFRPNGWFTEREETIIVNRVLRDDPSKGDMHNREGLTIRRLWTAICDYDLWPLYILGLMFEIPNTPPTTYLTLLLKDIGFNTFQINLLTIPSTAIGIVTMFIITLISESVDDRSVVAMAEDLWVLPFLIALYCLPENPNSWIFFGVVTGLLSYPLTHPIQVGWCSRNSGAVASRTVNASLYNMFVQISSIISSQIYVQSDAPRYERGNRILIIICCINLFVLYPGTKTYYVWRNRQRAKIWDAMTPEEQAQYLRTTKDKGNRRLDFRFAH
ncbi:allantoate permease [Leucogyrophana mollusca]|uniref:Allantoate permease n=1 Tax=Leucogyrophana mollusca TaxID=85980 RepID=A0ACB8B037_9AGAM|nr:allantoate permease [Leucogyrophana mollusca]